MFDELHQMGERLSARTRNLTCGQIVFRQESPITHIYLVCDGTVSLRRHGANGQTIVIHQCRGPAILAEASLHTSHYHCDGVAETDCELNAIDKASLLHEIETDPKLHRKWSAYLARQLLAARSRAEVIALKTVSERLDAWLLLNRSKLPERGQWHVLAGELAVSPEALYRELSRRRNDKSVF